MWSSCHLPGPPGVSFVLSCVLTGMPRQEHTDMPREVPTFLITEQVQNENSLT